MPVASQKTEAIRFAAHDQARRHVGGGGGGAGWAIAPPPPLWFRFCFCFLLVSSEVSHARWWCIPLPHYVNFAKTFFFQVGFFFFFTMHHVSCLAVSCQVCATGWSHLDGTCYKLFSLPPKKLVRGQDLLRGAAGRHPRHAQDIGHQCKSQVIVCVCVCVCHRRRRRGGGGQGALCPPQKKKVLKTKNSGKSSGNFGQKPWEIRAKAMGNSGKINGKFGKKQWKFGQKAIIFARNICRRFPSFLIAFAQIFHWFCPKFSLVLPEFPIAFPEIRAKAIGNSGKSNGQIWAKAMRKLGKRWIYFGQKYGSLG